MTSTLRTHRTWRRAAGLVLAGVVVFVAAAFATGRLAYVDTNGDSMEPLYHTAIWSWSSGRSVPHRRDGRLPRRYGRSPGDPASHRRRQRKRVCHKGDNNRSVDPTHPRASQIIGHAVLRIPRIGGVIGSPITHVVLLLALLALIVAFYQESCTQTQSHARRPPARDPWTTAWKLLLGLDVLLLAALGLSFGLNSAAANTPAYTQTGVFTYQAHPPVSDTYPTGHVVTGDPVFVKTPDRPRSVVPLLHQRSARRSARNCTTRRGPIGRDGLAQHPADGRPHPFESRRRQPRRYP